MVGPHLPSLSPPDYSEETPTCPQSVYSSPQSQEARELLLQGTLLYIPAEFGNSFLFSKDANVRNIVREPRVGILGSVYLLQIVLDLGPVTQSSCASGWHRRMR